MTDYKARAEREAAALLDEAGALALNFPTRDRLINLLAIAWVQGSIYGSHETLADAERSFRTLRESL